MFYLYSTYILFKNKAKPHATLCFYLFHKTCATVFLNLSRKTENNATVFPSLSPGCNNVNRWKPW